MQKQFSRNILLLLTINLVVKPIYVLLIDAQVQNAVGDADYGVYFALFNFCFLFQIILDMGIQNYNSKYLSQNRTEVGQHFSYVLGTRIGLILAFLASVLVAGALLGYPSTYMMSLVGVAAIMILQTFYVYLRSHFSALGYFRTESWLSALDKMLMITVLGYFIYVQRDIDISKFIIGQIAALCVAIVIAFILLGQKFSLSIQFSWRKTKDLISKSLPFAIVFILMTLYTRMDGVMLERLLDDGGASAGAYARGYRLLDAANILGYLFAMLLIPMYAKMLGDKSDVNPLVQKATNILLPISTIISVFCWCYATEIMDMIYQSVNDEHVQVFRLLMLSFWTMSMSYVFGALITASGELKVFNLIFCVGIVTNWGLNLYWIPRWGAEGAATATLITQSLVFIGQWILAKTKFALRYTLSEILRICIFFASTLAIFYFLSKNVGLHWGLESLIGVSLSLFISFLLGFIRLDLANEN